MISTEYVEADSISFDEDTHTYRNARGEIRPSVTQTLKPCFDYSRIDPAKLEAKRQIGSAVHKWTAQYDRGQEPDLMELSEIEEGYARGWLVCRAEIPMKFLEIETPMVRKILGVEVGGTPDRIVIINRRLFVLDIKCVAAFKPGWRLQLADYGMMYRERPSCNGIGRVIVRLLADGRYRWDPIDPKWDAVDSQVATGFLQTHVWLQNHNLR